METARVGILYRGKRVIRSLRMLHRDGFGEALLDLDSQDAVEDWMEQAGGGAKAGGGAQEADPSYLDYFYRCLDEGVEFYYVYESGVGWRVGSTQQGDVRGRLVGLGEWLRWSKEREEQEGI